MAHPAGDAAKAARQRIIEIRVLTLKPGSRAEFHRVYVERALPLLLQWKFDIVSFGPSPHDENTFYVIRSYDDLADRQNREDAYYGSDDWKNGPREALLSLIESYTDVVLEVDESTIAGLRRSGHPPR
jgi:NIPSNAP